MSNNDTWFSVIAHELSARWQSPVRILQAESVAGGDIHHAYCLHTDRGTLFVKTHTHPQAYRMFVCEFHALQAIANTHAIRVPEPILYHQAQGRSFLVMNFLEKGKPLPHFWEIFAEQLAALHRVTYERYGWEEDNFIGWLPQANRWMDHWPTFYAEQRLAPLLKQAFDQQLLSKADLHVGEQLLRRCSELLPNDRPSLLHGDLWGGNFLVSDNGMPAIFDPASYFGHREMDIAMADLFGGFDRRFFEAYATVGSLEARWRQRLRVYQLYYLLVHLILFGRTYYRRVMDILHDYAS
ncbi:MAG: fructosamine kinase family protein [Thermoflavifilum sp.]|nr:fructosamine kinase family protein [Thermoflavifilum sp.]